MDLKEIQNLIKFVAKSGASEVKLEMEDIKITIKTGSESDTTASTIYTQKHRATKPQLLCTKEAQQASEAQAPAAPAAKAEEDSKYITIKSQSLEPFIENHLQINLCLLK